MNGKSWQRSVGRIVLVISVLMAATPLLSRLNAQEDGAVRRSETVELEPLKCWWKTDKNAVHIAERFTLALTCAAVESSRITVVPDLTSLESSALQLLPFEVVTAIDHKDLRSAPRRYFQREYTVRLVGEGFFGQDVDIPSIKVSYRIQSQGADGNTEGRARIYVLPALPIRVLSLVPKKATDIQDSSTESFGDIEARRIRGTELLFGAGIFLSFALVLAGLAVVRVAGKHRTGRPAVVRPLPSRIVLRGCIHGVEVLKEEVARDGWSPERAGRALAALRVAAAVALGTPVAQELLDNKRPAREGQLVVRTGFLGAKRAVVSAPLTPASIEGLLVDRHSMGLRSRFAPALEQIRDALRVFDAARYKRDGDLDLTALDVALDCGTSAIRRLRYANVWLGRRATRAARAVQREGGVW
jgi:hypothetical protein